MPFCNLDICTYRLLGSLYMCIYDVYPIICFGLNCINTFILFWWNFFDITANMNMWWLYLYVCIYVYFNTSLEQATLRHFWCYIYSPSHYSASTYVHLHVPLLIHGCISYNCSFIYIITKGSMNMSMIKPTCMCKCLFR